MAYDFSLCELREEIAVVFSLADGSHTPWCLISKSAFPFISERFVVLPSRSLFFFPAISVCVGLKFELLDLDADPEFFR